MEQIELQNTPSASEMEELLKSVNSETTIVITDEDTSILCILLVFRPKRGKRSEIYISFADDRVFHRSTINTNKFISIAKDSFSELKENVEFSKLYLTTEGTNTQIAFLKVARLFQKNKIDNYLQSLLDTREYLETNTKEFKSLTETELLDYVKRVDEWDDLSLIDGIINHNNTTTAILFYVFWMIAEGIETSVEIREKCDHIVELISSGKCKKSKIEMHVSDIFFKGMTNEFALEKILHGALKEYVPECMYSTQG